MTKPPAPPSRARLPLAPQNITVPDNLSKPSDEKLQDMNFKVSSEFHHSFKMDAVSRRMSMKELLEACYAVWKEKQS